MLRQLLGRRWSRAAQTLRYTPLLSDPDDQEERKEENSNEEKITEVCKEEEKLQSKADYKIAVSHFVRIFSYSTPADKLLLLAAVVASIGAGITLPLMNVVFGQLVGVFSDFYDPASGDTRDAFLAKVDKNALYMVYFFFGRLCLDYVAILGFRTVSIRISAAMRLAYLEALLNQPVSVLDTLPPGQTAAIITIVADTLQNGISEKLSALIQSVALVITALVVAFNYSTPLTLVTSSGLILIVISYCVTTPRLLKLLKEVEYADRIMSSLASEVFGSIRMVFACQAEAKMAKRYAGWVEESRRRGLLLSPLVAFQHAPVHFAIHATFALSFWYAIRLYMDHRISNVADVIIVIMSIMTIVMSIGGIAAPLSAAARAIGSAGVLFSIIDAPRPHAEGIKAPEACSEDDIFFDNVTFAYPGRCDTTVLDNLTFRIPARKVTAIVGASGAGKSTIVTLLERWYGLEGDPSDPTASYFRSGTISVGRQNLNEIDLKWWRSQIGLVQQDPFLFNDTIFRNVEYGLIGTEWENESLTFRNSLVVRACKEAFAHDFIIQLPQGYDTLIGDAGLKLSGGQRQRVAIARSIVKQPRILILDEATSAIDVRSEKVVQAALDKVSRDRTTITIAHRLSTVMKADNILVMAKGKVVQKGTHQELFADQTGPYWALASAQHLSTEEYDSENSVRGSPGEQSDVCVSPEKISLDNDDQADIQQPTTGSKRLAGSFWILLWEQKRLSGWYSLMLIGTLGAGAAFPIQAFLFAKLVSVVNLVGDFLRIESNWWCFLFFALAVGVGISYYTLGWSSNNVAFEIIAAYRRDYFRNVLFQPLSYYDEEKNSIGSLTARMASDPAQLQQLLGINMAIVLISIFGILGSVTMSFCFGLKLTILTLLTAMPIILIAGFFRMRYEIQLEKMNQDVFVESSKFATESIGAFRTVSSLTLESTIYGRYKDLLHLHTANAYRKARHSTLIFAVSDSIALLCMAFVLWYGGQLLANHEYTPFNYLVVYLAIVQGSTSAGQSLSFGPNIAQAMAAADRIRRMRSRNKSTSATTSFDLENLEQGEKASLGVKIELQNVWFQYPTRDIPVLKGLNMTIEKGQFAAIVGPSGCGKTSIISLLERFYTAQAGRIICNGTDIKDISLEQYRGSTSLVSQEPSLFEGSIRKNILLGVDESETPDGALDQACRDAEIYDFVSSLPEGYETRVGGNGVALSGGQKQRIAIARALIRNPRLLLLDEATSNLDSETEKLVSGVFERTAKGRTTVVVAHRLATIQNADVIFVIGDGDAVEVGNHATLLAKKGLYYSMCQLQALNG